MSPTLEVLMGAFEKLECTDRDKDDERLEDYDEDDDTIGPSSPDKTPNNQKLPAAIDTYDFPSSSFKTPKNQKLPLVMDTDDSPKLKGKSASLPDGKEESPAGVAKTVLHLFSSMVKKSPAGVAKTVLHLFSSTVKEKKEYDLESVATVKENLRKFRDSERNLDIYNSGSDEETRANSLMDLKRNNLCYKDCWEARNMASNQVIAKIDKILEDSENSKGFEVPIQTKIIYVKEFGCLMYSGRKSQRWFEKDANGKENHQFIQLKALYVLIRGLLARGITRTLCSVPYLYEKEKLFRDSDEVAKLLNKICVTLRCKRENLNILGSNKGKVIGDFSVKFNNIKTSCAHTYFTIKAEEVQKYKFKVGRHNNPLAIILVEKDTVFHQLVSAKFHRDFQCIIITGCGQPDIATRIFLRKMRKGLQLPVFALTDGNPHGFDIFHTYLHGSKNMTYDSRNLRTRYIKWLGMRPSDLATYPDIEDRCQQGLGRRANALKENFIKDKHNMLSIWKTELRHMKFSIQIDQLDFLNLDFLSKKYLPAKLKTEIWL